MIIPIRELEATDVRGAIVSIPYPADVEEIVQKVQMLDEPYALLPPYSNDRIFTARCAAVCRDRFSSYKTLVAVSGVTRPQISEFLNALMGEGFTNFAFPYLIVNRDPLFMLTQFWPHYLKDNYWYHIAGKLPELGTVVPDKGTWTWSEEEL